MRLVSRCDWQRMGLAADEAGNSATGGQIQLSPIGKFRQESIGTIVWHRLWARLRKPPRFQATSPYWTTHHDSVILPWSTLSLQTEPDIVHTQNFLTHYVKWKNSDVLRFDHEWMLRKLTRTLDDTIFAIDCLPELLQSNAFTPNGLDNVIRQLHG